MGRRGISNTVRFSKQLPCVQLFHKRYNSVHMNQKTKELWLIPAVISFGTGIVLGVVFLYITAWATGATLRVPFTLGWIKSVFEVQIPLWGVLLFGAATAIVTPYFREYKTSWSLHGPKKHHELPEPKITQQAAATLHSTEQSDVTITHQLRIPTVEGTLLFESPELFAVRLSTFGSPQLRGIQLQIENYRLTSVHQVRIVLASASSFDVRHQDFREPAVSGQMFSRPNPIRPSGSGQTIPLIWKEARWPGLVTGENNLIRQLGWPENDKSEIETWKLSLRVQVFDVTQNAHGQSISLGDLPFEAVVDWERNSNVFRLKKFNMELPLSVSGFPESGEDGTHREIMRHIMCGQDQLLSYTTTRDGFPGTRFLVVRARPSQPPQSVETPDREAANAKWVEWYLEWKKQGFGGASGTGLDGAPPFES